MQKSLLLRWERALAHTLRLDVDVSAVGLEKTE